MRLLIVISIILCLYQCDRSPITGSENAEELNVSLEISSKEYSSTKLTANGIATNLSNSTIYPSWKIEAQFYHINDSGNTFLLGGDNFLINQSLQPNISVNFVLEISGSNGNFSGQSISSIDDFYIDELRAIEN